MLLSINIPIQFLFNSIAALSIRGEERNVHEKILEALRAKNNPSEPSVWRARTEAFVQVCYFRTAASRGRFKLSIKLLLFHLRCAVREELRRNFQLPNGIKALKIPRSMKRYVDLLQD